MTANESQPRLARIAIYPIKSLPPVYVDEAEVLPGGSLQFDRCWAIRDGNGNFVHAKQTDRVHRLRAQFSLADRRVVLNETEFELDDAARVSAWLSEFFGQPVMLVTNPTGGFPDDTDAPGPTLISDATLRRVAQWFSDMSLDEVRRRFRANLEITGVEPFWEDRLFTVDGGREFRIGGVSWIGTNPCQRCVVPSRHPETGLVTPDFSPLLLTSRVRVTSLVAAQSLLAFLSVGGEHTAVAVRLGTGEVGDLVTG